MEKALQAKTSREWVEILNTASVPGGPILNVFDRVVQEPGDRLVLVAAVLEDEGRDAEQVGEGGNRRPLPRIPAVV